MRSYANATDTSGVMFIAPSLTTYTFRNPSYRIYLVDTESGFIDDYTQYRLYLSRNETEWKIAYTMKEFFGV